MRVSEKKSQYVNRKQGLSQCERLRISAGKASSSPDPRVRTGSFTSGVILHFCTILSAPDQDFAADTQTVSARRTFEEDAQSDSL